MEVIGFVSLCLLVGVSRGQIDRPTSACQDLDSSACALFAQAKPDICSDSAFAQSSCVRFCGNCPLECYNCPTPVLNPNDCNTTTTCAVGQTCMMKHLTALDGHNEYIMSCEAKATCEGLTFGFGGIVGRRAAMFDEEDESDIEEHAHSRRDVALSCCDVDYCNFPVLTTTTTMPPTSSGPFPNGCNRDIVFVLDDSGSVGRTNFGHALDFVREIVQQIQIGPNNAMTGLMTYSTRPHVSWNLNTLSTYSQINTALKNVPYQGGITNTNDALETVRTQMLTSQNGDRPNAENVVIVLSDGRSNDKIDTIREATRLHAVSKDVISIVIGSGFDAQELQAIATDRHHVFDVHTYSSLNTIIAQLMQVICNQ
ncbi:collagen alpha-1(XIV) chain-like [Mya arenaria]|uniref:collagen alpha-1(XIV) chain-like n=1 Tax=Mya arenaria TaxID=6604 RepID=UPI0022E844F2|nr:collagen alpha-1(XIV) chain-like [Mya arenaria]